ncbi:MAG: hypothetical protein B6244_14860 [Candidatus Cloacimonetes bacterium 4572_55]|nr:MAG: hypothetical protein B6244_14860 [Candidatus Cloacimonetes bacterium 4572_55]
MTTHIDSFDMSLGKGAVWRYVIDGGSGANMRVGIIQAVWDQVSSGDVEYLPDEHSDDIGDTSAVELSVEKVTTTIGLRVVSSGGDFDIYVVRTIIGASF